jgi:uncharacterized cupredoxin-like copper-binding protein
MTRARPVLAVLAVLAVAAVVVPFAAARSSRTSLGATVNVTATEFKFVLSKKTAKEGFVTFVVTNKGKIAHDFEIDGRKTRNLGPGKTQRLRVRIAKAGHYPYKCTIDSHAKFGMKGVFTVTS